MCAWVGGGGGIAGALQISITFPLQVYHILVVGVLLPTCKGVRGGGYHVRRRVLLLPVCKAVPDSGEKMAIYVKLDIFA